MAYARFHSIRMPPRSDRPSCFAHRLPPRVSYVIAEGGDEGQRIDNFLMRELKNVPRSLVYRILRTGEVRVNGGRVKPDTGSQREIEFVYLLCKGSREGRLKRHRSRLRDFIATR